MIGSIWWPMICSAREVVSVVARGPSVISVTMPSRCNAPRNATKGCPGRISSARTVPMRSKRAPWSKRNRKCSHSRVSLSHHCRSSSRSSNGGRAFSTTRASASKKCWRCHPSVMEVGRGSFGRVTSISGTSRAISVNQAGSRAARDEWSASERSQVVTGA